MFSTIQSIEKPTPTTEQWDAYQQLYNYFNKRLFAGTLPSIILNFSRKANTCGFFSKDRWSRTDGAKTHEISINPVHLATDPFIQVCQTIAHEQVHLWQAEFGTTSRPGYHNTEWAGKMESVGLMPSSTGQPGGSRVGQKMSDYIIEGGLFEQAYNEMPQALRLPWKANEATLPPAAIQMLNQLTGQNAGGASTPDVKPKSKVKYTCLDCKAKAWGKPGLHIICGACNQRMQEAGE